MLIDLEDPLRKRLRQTLRHLAAMRGNVAELPAPTRSEYARTLHTLEQRAHGLLLRLRRFDDA